MANQSLNLLLRYLRHLAKAPGDSQTPDQELVERFLQQRDQSAFEALVRRHGALVYKVARRLLHQEQDAEDVFQATFLTLARKASSLRKPGSVASWLHGVAHRLALQMRAAGINRSAHESRVAVRRTDQLAEITVREAQELLDDELRCLSAKYRAPLVLCYLEGATRDEAARQLHLSLATLKRRLERGRELLRIRLEHRGLTVASALSGLLLTESAAQTAVPGPLVASTVQAALLIAADKPLVAGLVSTKAATLMEGMVRLMWITKLRIVALYIAIAVAATGTGLIAHRAWASKSPAAKTEQGLPFPGKDTANQEAVRKDQVPSHQSGESIKVSEGKNYFLSPITTELQRSLLPPHYQPALAYVILDGAALVHGNGTIDAAGLDWEALRKTLGSAKGRKDAVAVFHPIFQHSFPPDNARDVAEWALVGFGYSLGFGKAYLTISYNPGFNWNETRAAIAAKMMGTPDAPEPMTGNSAVHVYPVQTFLSRYLTGNADCVVRIVAPFKGPSADILEPEVDKSIRTYVSKLELKEKGTVEFRLGYKEGAREAVERFELNTSIKLAHELGFKNRLVTSSPEP